VKLLDFGIARLLSGGEAGEITTQTGRRALTPEYASPEQIQGNRVTTASDVYSLGVVLCELLAGKRPFSTDRRSLVEAERTFLEQEPERPSWIVARAGDHAATARSTTRARLARRLKGDLDTIVLTALRKDPERRYGTAEELASDIRRHLEHLPIAARGDDWIYRTRMFVRRHRKSGVAAAALLLAIGLVVLGVLVTIRGREAVQLAPPPPPSASVAVLPFTSVGGETQLRFGRLLMHEVVRQLDRLPDIRALTGERLMPERQMRLAQALGVRHLLAGTVDGAGSQIRVTANLVDANSASRLWSKTYENVPADMKPLAEQIAREAAAALLSPTIAFTSTRDGNDEIYVMTMEGARPINLTHHLSSDVDPTWSPDGRRIAFSSTRASTGNGFAIWVMNADGTGLIRLTDDPIGSEQAAWSPDGKRIAFMTSRDFNMEVYVMNSDGSEVMNLSRHPAGDEQPAWSPDGRHIAFVSNRDLDIEIYVMNADGTEPRRLTHSRGMDYEPAWSPDGRRIAFWSLRDGDSDIYVTNVDGTGTTRLTHHRAGDYQPTWTQVGSEILFHSTRDGASEIYVMNADGTDVRRLTFHPAEDMQPKVW